MGKNDCIKCHQLGMTLFKILTIWHMLEVLFDEPEEVNWHTNGRQGPNQKAHVIKLRYCGQRAIISPKLKVKGKIFLLEGLICGGGYFNGQIYMAMLQSNYYQGFTYKTMANECPGQCREGHIVPISMLLLLYGASVIFFTNIY